MKKKRFCTGDLKVATIIFSLSIQLMTKVAEANSPNSQFHISSQIIHQQQQQQPQLQPATSDSISFHFDRDQQHDSAPSVVRNRAAATATSASEADNPQASQSSSSSSSDDGASSRSNGQDQSEQEEADNSHELPDRNQMLLDQHNSQLQAMHDLFERRQLNNNNNNNNHHHQLQASQELNPISIGLDPVSGAGSPFNMPPFTVPNHHHDHSVVPHNKPSGAMANVDNLDQAMGPGLPFSLSPLPQLLGFQSSAFDGPQRGDQSAHANHHTAMSSTDSEVGQKVWPKIFRFTDGRINLSEFEKQKKIRLSSKNQHNTENHIESAPIMFDGRQLKRKSFLILHGGIFSRR